MGRVQTSLSSPTPPLGEPSLESSPTTGRAPWTCLAILFSPSWKPPPLLQDTGSIAAPRLPLAALCVPCKPLHKEITYPPSWEAAALARRACLFLGWWQKEQLACSLFNKVPANTPLRLVKHSSANQLDSRNTMNCLSISARTGAYHDAGQTRLF